MFTIRRLHQVVVGLQEEGKPLVNGSNWNGMHACENTTWEELALKCLKK
ncbi:matrix protein [Roseibium sp. TrichSKD4]|nr:matrix protein [Roseibium sp. TrichSKD4]